VSNWDLHDGFHALVEMYVKEVEHSFAEGRSVHTILLVAASLCIIAFLVFLFRPFLARVRKEGRRVAELLVQLPTDIDLDTLVAALTDITRAEARQPISSDGGAFRWGAQAAGRGAAFRGWGGGAGAGGAQQTPTVPLLGSSADGQQWLFSPRGAEQQQLQQHDSQPGGGSGGDTGMRRRCGASSRRVVPE